MHCSSILKWNISSLFHQSSLPHSHSVSPSPTPYFSRCAVVACLWWCFFLQSPSSSQSALFLVQGLHRSWVGSVVWFGHGGGLGLVDGGFGSARNRAPMVDQHGSVDGGSAWIGWWWVWQRFELELRWWFFFSMGLIAGCCVFFFFFWWCWWLERVVLMVWCFFFLSVDSRLWVARWWWCQVCVVQRWWACVVL